MNCPESVPVLPGDNVKSVVSTPVTFSLKVTLYTSVWLSVFSAAGLYLSIDASVGAVASAGTVLTVYVWSVPVVGVVPVRGLAAASAMP